MMQKGKKNIFCFFVGLIFFLSQIPYANASSEISNFLFDLGVKYYQQGKLEDALKEFKKVLLVDPNNQSALRYIQQIQQGRLSSQNIVYVLPTSNKTELNEAQKLELIELQQEMIKSRISSSVKAPTKIERKPLSSTKYQGQREKVPLITVNLDGTLNSLKQPIELPLGDSVIVKGTNITRFLVVTPEVVTAQKRSIDEVLITGKSIGYTFVHFWDANGRWTVEFSGTFPRIEGMTAEEYVRQTEGFSRNFKIRYSLEWSSFETGSSLESLERSTYSWAHNLGLTGESPYGDIDSALTVRSYNKATDLTFFTVGLNHGLWGPFKDFSLRGFDFTPSFSNLAFPSTDLRGAMLSSPAFNNKLHYTTFWGREGGGRYGNLSPNLAKQEDSFIEGINLDFTPTKKQDYQFSLLRGHGRDRLDYLEDYGLDFIGSYNFTKNTSLSYEAAYDTQRLAHLLKWRSSGERLSFSADYRHINKNFKSITGYGWNQGQIGWLLNANYNPMPKLSISASLDLYRDRLFPAEDNDSRWNQDFSANVAYRLTENTSISTSYSIANELGRVSQNRQQTAGAGVSYTSKILGKDTSLYLSAYHQENKDYNSHSTDYINERVLAGLRFNLLGNLYYYANQEYNFLRQRFNGVKSQPNAWETGIDWRDDILQGPLYGSLRFTYRDEEDTTSELSFLSGEDYIESYSELGYHSGDVEVYGGCSFRNIWKENPNTKKRTEMTFNAGLRYLWDTGLRWESVGNIEGYVFKDLNSDGLRQRDEPPVEGINITVGKRTSTTDLFGYYKVKGIRARKAGVSIDTTKLPAGYVLTVPSTQEVNILHNRTIRVDFGITARSEISGMVFEDANSNGRIDIGEKGVANVILVIDGHKKTVSDRSGRYIFSNVGVGEHTLTIDLSSLPVQYLPLVPIKKDITLYEGITYVYDIPLSKEE